MTDAQNITGCPNYLLCDHLMPPSKNQQHLQVVSWRRCSAHRKIAPSTDTVVHHTIKEQPLSLHRDLVTVEAAQHQEDVLIMAVETILALCAANPAPCSSLSS